MKNAKVLRSADPHPIERELIALRQSQGERSVILLPEEAPDTGGIELLLAELVRATDSLVGFDTTDVVAVSKDLSFGFVVEHFRDRTATGVEPTYRLMTWAPDDGR